MHFRALLAFLVLPGIFAGIIPALITHYDNHHLSGINAGGLILASGVLMLLLCVRDFLIAGRGTLAPWDPPQQLVMVGLYRFVRNPMYIAVIIIISGWTMSTGSLWLAAYGLLMATVFHLRVVFGEEPELAQQFNPQWMQYQSNVPRWLPQITAVRQEQ